jgi:hypothetical protein
MNILLDLNTKVVTEDIFKPTIRNKTLYEMSNTNGVRLVNFSTSKNISQIYNVPTLHYP